MCIKESVCLQDIPDKKRRWIMPIWYELLKEKHYLPWVFRNILLPSDYITFLTIDSKSIDLLNILLNVYSKNICNHNIIHANNITSSNFIEIINENNSDSFYSHANFASEILMMRNELLSEKLFNKMLAIWHEGGFLRHVCFQFDWMGWNALSSLAMMNIDWIPELSTKQKLFLDNFMNIFICTKIHYSKRSKFFTSLADIQSFFNITQPIAIIPLQVYKDSVITQFAPEKYLSLSWSFEFTKKYPDYFFIIIDHPKQRNFDHVPENLTGKNWIYLPHNTRIDTTSLCKYADAVVTVNSTVGFEALYWTPVFRAGKSVYSHKSITSDIENFPETKCSRKSIERFLYYAITQFHYTPQINSNNHREWFNYVEKNKNNYYLQKISHLDPPVQQTHKDTPDYSFLIKPIEHCCNHLRAGQIAKYFAINFLLPNSEILDVGGSSVDVGKFFYDIKRTNTTIVDIKPGKNQPHISFIQSDFTTFSSDKKFDGIWACHILEHILNVHKFLKNLVKHSTESAVLAIVVPKHNDQLVGGHINIFNPATLCYNVILAGQDLSRATVIVDDTNIALLWKRNDFELPILKYDRGDIEILQNRFPRSVSQGINAFSGWEKKNFI